MMAYKEQAELERCYERYLWILDNPAKAAKILINWRSKYHRSAFIRRWLRS